MNRLKEIWDGILETVCVKKCAACGELLEYDYPLKLCPDCFEEWEMAKREVCSVCGEQQIKCRCAFGKKYVDSVRHLVQYSTEDRESVADRIVYALKKSNNDSVFDFVAEQMSENLLPKIIPENTVAVSVPRNVNAIRKYGYDHAEKLARTLAGMTGIDYVNVLGHRKSKDEQKMLNSAQREANARKNCFLKEKSAHLIKDKNVILVDDIGTTGAMTGVCAELLKQYGAKSVGCLLTAVNKKN